MVGADVGVDDGAVDIEMALPDLGDSVVGWRLIATQPYASAEKPNISARSVSGRCVSVSYHPRQQVRPQGRLHVHP
jgi:hypothetical protein